MFNKIVFFAGFLCFLTAVAAQTPFTTCPGTTVLAEILSFSIREVTTQTECITTPCQVERGKDYDIYITAIPSVDIKNMTVDYQVLFYGFPVYRLTQEVDCSDACPVYANSPFSVTTRAPATSSSTPIGRYTVQATVKYENANTRVGHDDENANTVAELICFNVLLQVNGVNASFQTYKEFHSD